MQQVPEVETPAKSRSTCHTFPKYIVEFKSAHLFLPVYTRVIITSRFALWLQHYSSSLLFSQLLNIVILVTFTIIGHEDICRAEFIVYSEMLSLFLFLLAFRWVNPLLFEWPFYSRGNGNTFFNVNIGTAGRDLSFVWITH